MTTRPRIRGSVMALVALLGGLGPGRPAPAQDDPRPRADGAPSIEAINAEFDRELQDLERRRLRRLADLAASQDKAQAAETYETYFRLAIGANLFVEAEPIAQDVLRAGKTLSPTLAFLAHTVNIIAEADRGAYDESLASLKAAFAEAEADPDRPASALPTATRLALAEAYYQKLLQGERFDVARRVMELIRDRAASPAGKDFADRHLKALDLLGRPAPPIEGPGIDGPPVRLADSKGDVVLVVFWTTWSVPSAREVARLEQARERFGPRGFRILGVNLDTLRDDGRDRDEVLADVRRFLIERNVTWPNVLNGRGDQDHAAAYGVAEVPANFLVGRDGTVVGLDLTGASLARAVARALGR